MYKFRKITKNEFLDHPKSNPQRASMTPPAHMALECWSVVSRAHVLLPCARAATRVTVHLVTVYSA